MAKRADICVFGQHVANMTESDVEQKIVLPLLTEESIFNIPPDFIKTKKYLRAFDIGKGDKLKRAYVPDYYIFIDSVPVFIVEVKSPHESAEQAIDEARQYASKLNQQYPENINPIKYVAGCNGYELFVGLADTTNGTIKVSLEGIDFGNKVLAKAIDCIGIDKLKAYAQSCGGKLYPKQKAYSALRVSGGIKKAHIPVPNNAFFGSGLLTELISTYFNSEGEDTDEIIDKAYVASAEVHKFDSELDLLLKDRLRKDKEKRYLEPKKDDEVTLNKCISEHISFQQNQGSLQLVIGAVGSGKSLFLRRFYRKLLKADSKEKTLWAFINFNKAPSRKKDKFEDWICEQFLEEIDKAWSEDIFSLDIQEKIFSVELKRRKSVYNLLQQSGDESAYKKQLAEDLKGWLDDKVVFCKALTRYLSGERGLTIVVVFDNVDRRDKEEQLSIFQDAQWFKDNTRSLCFLNLRDTTYEAFKKEPPLDAFTNSTTFYLQAPYMHEVIKRRLALAAQKVLQEGQKKYTCTLANGSKVEYEATRVADYLKAVYESINGTNGARILAALSNKSVRVVLQLFATLIKSGHIEAEKFISTAYMGTRKITERELLRALMRGPHKYYDGKSRIHNIFGSNENSKRPNSFIKIQSLSFLSKNHNHTGDISVNGFFYVKTVISFMEKQGFDAEDIVDTLKEFLADELIVSDRYNSKDLELEDVVKISASGHLHLKFLTKRMEYISACSFSANIASEMYAKRIGECWQIDMHRKDINADKKVQSANYLLKALIEEYNVHTEKNPIFEHETNAYKMDDLFIQIKQCIDWTPADKKDADADPMLPFPELEQ